MRKGQMKYIEKAEKEKFPKAYIEYIRNSEDTIEELGYIYYFFRCMTRYSSEISENDIDLYKYLQKKYHFGKYMWSNFISNICKLSRSEIDYITKNTTGYISCLSTKIYTHNEIPINNAVKLAYYVRRQKGYYKEYLEICLLSNCYQDEKYDKKLIYKYPIEEKIKIAKIFAQSSDEKYNSQYIKYSEYSVARKKLYYAMNKNINSECFATMIRTGEWFKNEFETRYPFENHHINDEDGLMNKLQKIVKENNIQSKMTLAGKFTKLSYSINSSCLTIDLCCYSRCCYNGLTSSSFYEYEQGDTCEKIILFFDSGDFYIKNKKNKKLYLVSFKKISYLIEYYGKPLLEAVNIILDFYIEHGNYVFKDIKRALNEKKKMPPLTMSECVGKYTLQEVYSKKYKKVIPINWNKGDLYINYLFYKGYDLIREQDRLYFLQQCNDMAKKELIDDFYNFLKKEKSYYHKEYLLFVYLLKNRNIGIEDLDSRLIAYDYCNNARLAKEKIKLKFNSYDKLVKEHDRLYIDYMNTKTPKITIPKDSKYNRLRKLLPKEFEWIKTRSRIILEGRDMCHCVATYADYINNDDCAIYSFVYAPTETRYTIEFIWRNNTYRIAQIQSCYNSGCPQEVREYVENYLREVKSA